MRALKALVKQGWADDREVEIVAELPDGALAFEPGVGEVFLLAGTYEIIPPECIICFRACARCSGACVRGEAHDVWRCPACKVTYTSENLFYRRPTVQVPK